MKHLIITTALVAAASLSFYVYEGGPIEKSIGSISQSASFETVLNLGMVGNTRLDIIKLDVK